MHDCFSQTNVESALQYDSTNFNALLLKEPILEENIKSHISDSLYDEMMELINVVSKLHDYGYEPMSDNMQELLLAEIKFADTKVGKIYSFQSIDENSKYCSLSKNKFPELHLTSNEYNLGMFSMNISTGNIPFNKTFENTENSIDPVMFALSIDPLSEKFPSVSPYNAMGNNPVNLIDPNGMATAAITPADIVNIRSNMPEDYTAKDLITTFKSEMDKYNDNDPGAIDAKVRGTTILTAMSGADLNPETKSAISAISVITKDGNTFKLYTTNQKPLEIKQDNGNVITINNGAQFTVTASNEKSMTISTSNVTVNGTLIGRPINGGLTTVVLGAQSAIITIKIGVVPLTLKIPYDNS
jgi:hypothetical protein